MAIASGGCHRLHGVQRRCSGVAIRRHPASGNSEQVRVIVHRLLEHYFEQLRGLASASRGRVRGPAGDSNPSGYGNRFMAMPSLWLLALAGERCLHIDDMGLQAFFNPLRNLSLWQCPPAHLALVMPSRRLGKMNERQLAHALSERSELQGGTEVTMRLISRLSDAGHTHLHQLLERLGATPDEARNESFLQSVGSVGLFHALSPAVHQVKQQFVGTIHQACRDDADPTNSPRRLDAGLHLRTGADLILCGQSAAVTRVQQAGRQGWECGTGVSNLTLRCATRWIWRHMKSYRAKDRRPCIFVMSDMPSVAEAAREHLLRAAPLPLSVVTERMLPGTHRIQLTFRGLDSNKVEKWVPQWQQGLTTNWVPLRSMEWQNTQWHTGPLHRIAKANLSAAIAHPSMLGWLALSEARIQLSLPSTFSESAGYRGASQAAVIGILRKS